MLRYIVIVLFFLLACNKKHEKQTLWFEDQNVATLKLHNRIYDTVGKNHVIATYLDNKLVHIQTRVNNSLISEDVYDEYGYTHQVADYILPYNELNQRVCVVRRTNGKYTVRYWFFYRNKMLKLAAIDSVFFEKSFIRRFNYREYQYNNVKDCIRGLAQKQKIKLYPARWHYELSYVNEKPLLVVNIDTDEPLYPDNLPNHEMKEYTSSYNYNMLLLQYTSGYKVDPFIYAFYGSEYLD